MNTVVKTLGATRVNATCAQDAPLKNTGQLGEYVVGQPMPLLDDNNVVYFGDGADRKFAVPKAEYPNTPLLEGSADVTLPAGEYRVYPRTREMARIVGDVIPLRIDGPDFMSPCMRDPRIDEPWVTQRLSADFMCKHPRCFILNDTGTGKTRSAAWAAKTLMDTGDAKRCLILCTLTTVYDTWVADIEEAVPGIKVDIAHGSANVRNAALSGDAPFAVANHDITKSREFLRDGIGKFDIVVIDEISTAFGTWMSGSESSRSAALKKFLHAANDKGVERIWAMTATPQSQGAHNVWNLADVVRSGYYDLPTRTRFISDVSRTIPGTSRRVPRSGADMIAARALAPSLRVPAGYGGTYVPTSRFADPIVHMVPLSDEQKAAMVEVKAFGRTAAQAELEASGEISLPTRSRVQNAIHAVAMGALRINYEDAPPTTYRYDSSEKFAKLVEIMNESPTNTLVLCKSIAVLEMVDDFLERYGAASTAQGFPFTHGIIRGSVSVKKRSKLMRQFRDEADPMKVILAQSRTVSHGVTLVSAARTVLWGPAPDTESYIQGIARTDRPGQVHDCEVHLLLSTQEERTTLDAHLGRITAQQAMLQQTDFLN